MNCPQCPNEQLVITDRQGIEIDYCPKCRGVWLDRGELDKLIERSNQYDARRRDNDDDDRRYAPPRDNGYAPQQGYPPQNYPPQGHYGHKKKKSFWSELFD